MAKHSSSRLLPAAGVRTVLLHFSARLPIKVGATDSTPPHGAQDFHLIWHLLDILHGFCKVKLGQFPISGPTNPPPPSKLLKSPTVRRLSSGF